jgi:hypothetical protein
MMDARLRASPRHGGTHRNGKRWIIPEYPSILFSEDTKNR